MSHSALTNRSYLEVQVWAYSNAKATITKIAQLRPRSSACGEPTSCQHPAVAQKTVLLTFEYDDCTLGACRGIYR